MSRAAGVKRSSPAPTYFTRSVAKRRRVHAATNEKTAVQAGRFRVRDPGALLPCAVSAAAAAELLGSRVCMTSDISDMDAMWEFLPFSVDPCVVANNAKSLVHSSSHWMAGSTKRTQTDLLVLDDAPSRVAVSFAVSDGAVAILQAGAACPQPFRALKMTIPGHIAIAVWDNKRQVVEIFDSDAALPIYGQILIAMVQSAFRHAKVGLPRTVLVNASTLQQQDWYCQTYIYYYLVQRALADEPAYRIIANLHSMTPMERFLLMSQFQTSLVRM